MNVKNNLKLNKSSHTALFYGIATIFGVVNGFSNIEILQNVGLLISDTFIKIFKCISLPIIALSLIVALSQLSSDHRVKNIWKRTLFYTISTTLIAAIVACLLYLIIEPKNISTVAGSVASTQTIATQNSYLSSVTTIIPKNVFSPFLENHVMGVLLVSMIFGFAIRAIPDDTARHAMMNFFKGLYALFLVITQWIVKLIPLALFGFITSAITQLKGGFDIGSIGGYLLVVVLANLIQGAVILPLFLALNKINPLKSFKGMLPALSVAFFSKSSAATLPVTMDTIEKNLGVPSKISRFILPLCTTINMNACAAFIFTTVIYLMQNNGMDITLGTMILWIFIATLAAIGNAGVPMGCFFLSTSLLVSMNVPIVLLALILPLYGIIDMIETALNVWSDACVTKVISKKSELPFENTPEPCTVLQEQV